MGRDEIELDVEMAITTAVLIVTQVKEMTFSLVPAKALQDGGLGLRITAYTAFLDVLIGTHLPRVAPYTNYMPPKGLARSTHDKPLRTLRYELTEQLFALAQGKTVQGKSVQGTAVEQATAIGDARRTRAKRGGR